MSSLRGTYRNFAMIMAARENASWNARLAGILGLSGAELRMEE
jgi:hypothetical protein